MTRRKLVSRAAIFVAALAIGTLCRFYWSDWSARPAAPRSSHMHEALQSTSGSDELHECPDDKLRSPEDQNIGGRQVPGDSASGLQGDALRRRIDHLMKNLLTTALRTGGVGSNLLGSFGDDTSLDRAYEAFNAIVWSSEESFFVFLELFSQVEDPQLRWVVMQYLSPGYALKEGKVIFSRAGVDQVAGLLVAGGHDLPMYRILGSALFSLIADKSPAKTLCADTSLLVSHDTAVRLVEWLREGLASSPQDLERKIMLSSDFRRSLAGYVHLYPEVRRMFVEFIRDPRSSGYLRTCETIHALARLGCDDDEVFRLAMDILYGRKYLGGEDLPTLQRDVARWFLTGSPTEGDSLKNYRSELFYQALHDLSNTTEDKWTKEAVGKRLGKDMTRLEVLPTNQIKELLGSSDVPWETKKGILDSASVLVNPLKLLLKDAFPVNEQARTQEMLSLLYSFAENPSSDERLRTTSFELLLDYYSEYVKRFPDSSEAKEFVRLVQKGKHDPSELVRSRVVTLEDSMMPEPRDQLEETDEDNKSESNQE